MIKSIKGFKFRYVLCIFIMLPFCVSCKQGEKADFILQEEADFAQNWLERLRAGDYEYAYNHADEELKADLTPEVFESFVLVYPKENVKKLSLLRWNYSKAQSLNSAGLVRYSFYYEYEFENGDLVIAEVLCERNDGVLMTVGAALKRTTESQRNVNKLTLKNKSAKHYAVLFLMFLMFLYSVSMLVVCIRTRFPLRQKIPWLLFISVGFGAVDINWTTGMIHIQLLHIHLLSAAALIRSDFAWHVVFGIPVGAILFWFKRKRILLTAKNNNEVV